MAEHVFAGEPDARQSTDPEMKPSRFRPRYRTLNPQEMVVHDKLKAWAAEGEELFRIALMLKHGADAKGSRYHSLAITELEMSLMWIVKDLTS